MRCKTTTAQLPPCNNTYIPQSRQTWLHRSAKHTRQHNPATPSTTGEFPHIPHSLQALHEHGFTGTHLKHLASSSELRLVRQTIEIWLVTCITLQKDHIPGLLSAVIVIERNYLRDKDPDYESCIGEAIGE